MVFGMVFANPRYSTISRFRSTARRSVRSRWTRSRLRTNLSTWPLRRKSNSRSVTRGSTSLSPLIIYHYVATSLAWAHHLNTFSRTPDLEASSRRRKVSTALQLTLSQTQQSQRKSRSPSKRPSTMEPPSSSCPSSTNKGNTGFHHSRHKVI